MLLLLKILSTVCLCILCLLGIEGFLYLCGAHNILNTASYNTFEWIAQICAFIVFICLGIFVHEDELNQLTS